MSRHMTEGAADSGTSLQRHMGRRMRAQRVLLGMSQAALAARAEIPQSHISRYEQGHFAAMHPGRLLAIAAALGVTPNFLLGWSPRHARAALRRLQEADAMPVHLGERLVHRRPR